MPESNNTEISRDVWQIAIVVVFGAFMAGLDTSLVNVGLDTIVHQLHGTLSSAQWVSSAYLIALAAALPICGWLSRRIGVARLWLWALAAFTLLSSCCAMSPNLLTLILFRVLQGLAGGLLVPSGQTLIGRAAGPRHMGTVMNTAGIAVVLAPAIGPAIGGMLIAALSWKWLFLVNLPIGLVAFILGRRILPSDDEHHAGPLDLAGLFLLTAGFPICIYGVIEATRLRSAIAASVITTLPLGLLLLLAYGVRAKFAKPGRATILDLSLFANRTYAAAQTSVFFCGASLFGGLIILPLYYQILRRQSVVSTGLLLLAYGVGSAVSLRLGGKLTDRMGGGITAVIGLVLTIATTLPFLVFGAGANIIIVEVLLFLRGVGASFAGLPVMSSAYAVVDRDSLPDATVQANILLRIGGSLGSALFVLILEQRQPVDVRSFHVVFGWLTVTATLALATSAWLAIEQRRSLTSQRHPGSNTVGHGKNPAVVGARTI
jgi:EmrB/QacA subfamily drug resistance transporter